ncbi:MAG: Rhomboid family protein, partial [uncultured Nocardioides sp.]
GNRSGQAHREGHRADDRWPRHRRQPRHLHADLQGDPARQVGAQGECQARRGGDRSLRRRRLPGRPRRHHALGRARLLPVHDRAAPRVVLPDRLRCLPRHRGTPRLHRTQAGQAGQGSGARDLAGQGDPRRSARSRL